MSRVHQEKKILTFFFTNIAMKNLKAIQIDKFFGGCNGTIDLIGLQVHVTSMWRSHDMSTFLIFN